MSVFEQIIENVDKFNSFKTEGKIDEMIQLLVDHFRTAESLANNAEKSRSLVFWCGNYGEKGKLLFDILMNAATDRNKEFIYQDVSWENVLDYCKHQKIQKEKELVIKQQKEKEKARSDEAKWLTTCVLPNLFSSEINYINLKHADVEDYESKAGDFEFYLDTFMKKVEEYNDHILPYKIFTLLLFSENCERLLADDTIYDKYFRKFFADILIKSVKTAEKAINMYDLENKQNHVSFYLTVERFYNRDIDRLDEIKNNPEILEAQHTKQRNTFIIDRFRSDYLMIFKEDCDIDENDILEKYEGNIDFYLSISDLPTRIEMECEFEDEYLERFCRDFEGKFYDILCEYGKDYEDFFVKEAERMLQVFKDDYLKFFKEECTLDDSSIEEDFMYDFSTFLDADQNNN